MNDYKITAKVKEVCLSRLRSMKIPDDFLKTVEKFYIPLAEWLAEKKKEHPGLLLVGISGAQGSGKSTLCEFLKIILDSYFSLRTAIFSIDDLYKTREERTSLAQTVHPLLKTRGVPGTHDVDMGLKLINDLKNLSGSQSLAIPRFDKALDDRQSKRKMACMFRKN